jgi:hypothetical protein
MVFDEVTIRRRLCTCERLPTCVLPGFEPDK